MIKISDHFHLEEITPRDFDGGIECFHPQYVEFLEQIHSVVGSMIINDWCFGKTRQWRGLRLPACPEWSAGSKHSYIPSRKLCTAFDATCLDCSADEARKLLLDANPALLGRLEADVSWLHCDMGPRKNGKIYVFHK